MLESLKSGSTEWDVIIIGGGATGLGAAVDASSRGYKTLLLEQHDFSKGTSSRSTKLVHGGVRYLQQGNISLVLEALRERGLLLKNAPHIATTQSFIVPNYKWWERPFYGIGMKMYDLLAGKLGIGSSKHLSKKETVENIPTINTDGLRGGTLYYDGQFDDSRLAVNLAQTALENGATILNYTKVTGLMSADDKITGVTVTDAISGEQIKVEGKTVVNATGIFTDDILKMEDPDRKNMIVTSQGVHVVLDKKFLPGKSALMVPKTDDGRVLFAVPWHDKVIVGTTDTPVDYHILEPEALEEEIDFILEHAAKYLDGNPTRDDVRSIFAGLRPLVMSTDSKDTSAISRDHTLLVSPAGLITITGGKWTTYRKMAEDTVNQAIKTGGLQHKKCVTENLKIHGWQEETDRTDPLHVYGSDSSAIKKLIKDRPELEEKIHERLPYTKAEVVWSTRNELAVTVEDILARRTRSLLLDAKASIDAAPLVAKLMAEEQGKNKEWQTEQVQEFTAVAKKYVA